MPVPSIILCLFILSAFIPGHAQDTISLHGEWKITLDGNYKDWPVKMGFSEGWFKSSLPSNQSVQLLNRLYLKNASYQLNDYIQLPGTTDEAGIGVPLIESASFTIGLERNVAWDGAFWVQRMVTIPQEWAGKTVILEMERLLGSSTVFWNDQQVGGDYGLAFPHRIIINEAIKPGTHRLTVLVNKDDQRYLQYGHHMVSGNGVSWNGILGKLHLIAMDPHLNIRQIRIFPQLKSGHAGVEVLTGGADGDSNGYVVLSVRKKGSGQFTLLTQVPTGPDTLRATVKIPEPVETWSEFNPALYELKVDAGDKRGITDSRVVVFGMREIGTANGQITMNGKPVFMRGTLDNGESPLSGYPATSKPDWLKKFTTFKAFGINLVRFHTWCPPDAAFEAADEVGLYLQPELSGAPYAEIDRILERYGNHPSFCLFSLNNEAFSHNDLTRKIIDKAKKSDNRHLYSCTTHPVNPTCTDDFFVSAWGNHPIPEWPNSDKIVGITWGGGDNVTASRFNTNAPETMSDYTKDLKNVPAPLLSHEVGQWAMFPDFREIRKYAGSLRNTNYERFKSLFESKNPEEMADQFFKASGRFSSILYKEEIESALRTPQFGGFELLGLMDYQGQWTAVVGQLDAFATPKGLISPDEHRQYCAPVVPLARLKQRVFSAGDTITAGIEIANYSFEDQKNKTVLWKVTGKAGKVFYSGNQKIETIPSGGLTSAGTLLYSLPDFKEAEKLDLVVEIAGEEITNRWDIWVYPNSPETSHPDIRVATGLELNQVKKYLEKGEKVLLILNKSELKDSRAACFAPIFWNSLFKWPQKSHTLGIYCDPSHAVFQKFPTEFHSNWQWWDVTMNASAVNISSLPKEFKPLISVIDSYHISDKLSLLFECKVGKGRLVVSTVDFFNLEESDLAARQLKESILNYMESDQFNPADKLEFNHIENLLVK